MSSSCIWNLPPLDEILFFGLEEPENLWSTLSGFAGCLGIEDFAGPFWISESLVPLGVPLALDFEDADWLIDPLRQSNHFFTISYRNFQNQTAQ